jgi:6-phosphogluconolactonase
VSAELHRFRSNGELCEQLAHWVALDLRGAIDKRGGATLAVSGGSTPLPLFERLAERALDWSRVTVTLVDERWVAAEHPDANARLVRDHLLRGAAAAARFIPLKSDHPSPFDAEATIAARLAPFAGAIDAVILGMGGDGHTASFFPGADTLEAAIDPAGDRLCVALTPPAAPHARMSLTLAALQRARNSYLHITGPQKLAVLEAALADGPVAALPVRAILRRPGPPVDVFYAPEQ